MPSFLRSRKRGHKALTLHTESLLLPICWQIESPVSTPVVEFWFACRFACRAGDDEIGSPVNMRVVHGCVACRSTCQAMTCRITRGGLQSMLLMNELPVGFIDMRVIKYT